MQLFLFVPKSPSPSSANVQSVCVIHVLIASSPFHIYIYASGGKLGVVKSVKGRRGTPASRTSRLNASSAKASTANSSAMPGSSRRNSEHFSAAMPHSKEEHGDDGEGTGSTTRFDFDVSIAATPSLGRSIPAVSCLRRKSHNDIGLGSNSSFGDSHRPRSLVQLPSSAQGQLEEWRSRPHTLAHFGVVPSGPSNAPAPSSALLHPIPPVVPEGGASSPDAAATTTTTTTHGLSSRAASTVPVSRPSSPVGMDSSSRRKRNQQGQRRHTHATRSRTHSHGQVSSSGGTSRGEQSTTGSDGGASYSSSVGAGSAVRHNGGGGGISSDMSSESTRSCRDRTSSRARFASKDRVSGVSFGMDDDNNSSGGGSGSGNSAHTGGGVAGSGSRNKSSVSANSNLGHSPIGVLVTSEGGHERPESPLSDDVSFYEDDRYSSSGTGSGDAGSGVPSGGVIFSGAAFLLQREQAASYASTVHGNATTTDTHNPTSVGSGNGEAAFDAGVGTVTESQQQRPVTATPGNKHGFTSSDSMGQSPHPPDLPLPPGGSNSSNSNSSGLNSAMVGSNKHQASGVKPSKKCASVSVSQIDEVIPPPSALPDRSSPIFSEGRGSKM